MQITPPFLPNCLDFIIVDEGAMLDFGKKLAAASSPGNVIYFHGELGVGKTTLARGFLRGCGHEGPVKSPTYALVEDYRLVNHTIFHFDLYRLMDAEELEYMGARDYFSEKSICLVEWAENGDGFLPLGDLVIRLSYREAGGRKMNLVAQTPEGQRMLAVLQSIGGLYSAREL